MFYGVGNTELSTLSRLSTRDLELDEELDGFDVAEDGSVSATL